MNFSRIHLDLGIRSLLPVWRRLFTRDFLRQDAVAGVTVACVAMPLSLAIALASGVSPAVGLTSAVIGGVVCAFFGGATLAVSGPAAAMAVLIASVVEKHGAGGLIVVGFLAGLMQMLTGVFRLGRLVHFVPLPVVAGFTAGIGGTILIQQAPRALGLPPPDSSHAIDVISHAWEFLSHTQWPSLGLSAATLAVIFLLPRISKKVPAVLAAVLISTGVAEVLGLGVERIGSIPRSLPWPKMPVFPTDGWDALVAAALLVYAVASLESLLSAASVDKLAKGEKHDSDQELIGQGLGNVAVSLFGGIPVTSVIVRSALNLQSGARTRRAAVIHALVLLAMIYLLAPLIEKIPLAVLAGVLLAVAVRMLSPREFAAIWSMSRTDAIVYAVTFLVIVFVDLLAGVRAGVVAALAIVALRLARTHSLLQTAARGGPYRLFLSGPLTFLANGKITALRDEVMKLAPTRGIIFDLSDVPFLDGSGAEQITEFLHELREDGWSVALLGLQPTCQRALLAADRQGNLVEHFALSEEDVPRALGRGNMAESSSDKLRLGVQRYRSQQHASYEALFDRLATGQHPHTLFITCSDSRIQPNLITSTNPGELFLVRNVGNIVPPYGHDDMPAENAAIEYALEVLGVRQIVVCGHSGCGAIAALLAGRIDDKLPSVRAWLSGAYPPERFRLLYECATPDEAAQRNALQQLENLQTNPRVQERLKRGQVELNAWFYDIAQGEVSEYDATTGRFVPVTLRAVADVPR